MRCKNVSEKKMSLDALLEEALVPADEQSYKIPDNWVWTKFGNVASLKNGHAFKSTDFISEGIAVIRISDIHNNVATSNNAVKVPLSLYNDSFKIEKGDLLIAMSGATTGKTGIYVSEDVALQNQRVGNIKEHNKQVLDRKYKNYFVIFSSHKILEKAYGGAQPNVSGKIIESLEFPLPPIAEQKRITDKIETLFTKLDKVKQLIEEVKESFELRRAAILANAFEMYEPTCYKTIEEVCTIKNGYAFKSKDFVDEGMQLVRMGNLYQNQLDLSRSPVYIPTDYNEKLLDKYCIKNGDILLTLTGTKYKRDYGYAVKMEHLDRDLLLNQRIMSLTPNTEDDYLFYFLQTPEFRNDFFSFETGGVNQGNVGSKSVATIKIPWIEDISKRREVVNSIQKQLKVENTVSEILNNQFDIDNLKQSILSKAFKGELNTNNPADEPAIELLKSILQEKL